MRKVHKLAFLLILIGGVLVLNPTFSFSSLTADRGTSISTAADDSALIALNKSVQGEMGHKSYTTIGTLENNLDGHTGVTYKLYTSDPDSSLSFDGNTGTTIDGYIELGQAENIGLRCASGNSGDDFVTVTTEIVEATNGDVAITDAKMDITVSCNGSEVPESGDVQFVSLNVTVNETNSGKIDSTMIEWEVDDPDQAEYVQIDTTYTDPVEVDPTASPYEITNYNGNRKFPADVTVDIAGGERCALTFDSGGEKTLEDCN